tara:strand:- start:2574 stop:4352 length:1779 start_codon:yes stop_codon:yes gene_type:complete
VFVGGVNLVNVELNRCGLPLNASDLSADLPRPSRKALASVSVQQTHGSDLDHQIQIQIEIGSTMHNLKACHETYGKKNFDEFKRRLIGGTYKGKPLNFALVWTGFFARYGYEDGRKTCKPTVTKSYYNDALDWNGFDIIEERTKWKMKRRDIIEHLVCDNQEIERMVAYVNRCPIIGDFRIGLFCFDIDNHKKLSQANVQKCKRLIERVFKGAKIYWEASTTGSGLHGYILISWDPYMDNSRIRCDIRELQRLVGQITADLRTNCNEIRGIPHLLHNRRISGSGYGQWAKFPRPRTSSDMESFLSATSQHSSCSDLLDQAYAFLGLEMYSSYLSPCITSFLQDEIKEQTASKSRPFTDSAAIPSTSTNPYPHPTTSLLSGNTNVLGCKPSLDTKERTLEFASKYFRSYFQSNGTLPSYGSLHAAYMKAGLMIGNSDDRCLRNDYKYLSKTFDKNKSKRSVLSYFSDAEMAIDSCLKNNGIVADLAHDRVWRRMVYKRKGFADSTISRLYEIKRIELVQVYACMLYDLDDKKNCRGTFGKKQCKTLLKIVFGTKIDNKKYKAIIGWLRRNRLVKIVKKHRRRVCTVYQLVKSE